MQHSNLFIVLVAATLFVGCAAKPAQTAASPKVSAADAATAKSSSNQKNDEPAIVGTPTARSKFANLKIGMTAEQVTKLIGQPTKQWTHPTGKAAIPFYFGDDRWALQYSYKGKGLLTFNYGGNQILTRMVVNKAE
jgi:hypothetical protein